MTLEATISSIEENITDALDNGYGVGYGSHTTLNHVDVQLHASMERGENGIKLECRIDDDDKSLHQREKLHRRTSYNVDVLRESAVARERLAVEFLGAVLEQITLHRHDT